MSTNQKISTAAIVSIGLLTLAALVLAVGLAAGLAINWIFPSFGLGISTVLALVTIVIMGQLLIIFARLAAFASAFPSRFMGVSVDDGEEYDEEEYEPDLLSEEQVEYVADQLSEAVIARLLAAGQEQHSPRPKHRSRR